MTDAENFRAAMQRFAAAATAITTMDGDTPAGLMATAVCSLSADPPSLVLCINRDATAYEAIMRAGFIGVSLIPEHAEDFARHFAQAKGVDRFRKGEWITGQTGAPLLSDAPVAFDCRILSHHDGFSHTVIIAEILGFRFGADERTNCLMWHRRNFTRVLS